MQLNNTYLLTVHFYLIMSLCSILHSMNPEERFANNILLQHLKKPVKRLRLNNFQLRSLVRGDLSERQERSSQQLVDTLTKRYYAIKPQVHLVDSTHIGLMEKLECDIDDQLFQSKKNFTLRQLQRLNALKTLCEYKKNTWYMFRSVNIISTYYSLALDMIGLIKDLRAKTQESTYLATAGKLAIQQAVSNIKRYDRSYDYEIKDFLRWFLTKVDRKKLDLSLQDNQKNNILHLMACHAELLPCIIEMVKDGANPNQANASGQLPLHCAISKNTLPTIEFLMFCSNVNARNKYGFTPLGSAIQAGVSDAVKLLSHHPQVRYDVLDNRGYNALDIAQTSAHHDEEIIEFLLDCGCTMTDVGLKVLRQNCNGILIGPEKIVYTTRLANIRDMLDFPSESKPHLPVQPCDRLMKNILFNLRQKNVDFRCMLLSTGQCIPDLNGDTALHVLADLNLINGRLKNQFATQLRKTLVLAAHPSQFFKSKNNAEKTPYNIALDCNHYQFITEALMGALQKGVPLSQDAQERLKHKMIDPRAFVDLVRSSKMFYNPDPSGKFEFCVHYADIKKENGIWVTK